MTALLRRRGAALLLAVAVAGVGVLFQHHAQKDPHVTWSRFSLPGFDAYVYIAMAEHPSIFTVAPWGYRVLTPSLVRALGIRSTTAGFRKVTLSALTAAGVLLFLYLRRLGHGPGPALLGVALFALSPPIADIVKHRFLVDPLTIALWILFLWAVEAGAPTGALVLVAVLGALSKELFVLVLPAALLVRGPPSSGSRAFRFGVTLAGALAGLIALRLRWPAAHGGASGIGVLFFWAALSEVLRSFSQWLGPVALGGLVPMAIAGLAVRDGRAYAFRNIVPFGGALLLPFAAAVYPGEGRVVDFYEGDVTRLLVYALPWLVALTLFAAGALFSWRRSEPPSLTWPRASGALGAVLAVSAVATAGFALDGYRRVDLSGPRDGPRVLATSRESIRVATILAEGRPYTYDFAAQSFVWGESDPTQLRDARWFLGEGFGARDERESGVPTLKARSATLLVPLLRPQAVEIGLDLEAPSPTVVRVVLNGAPVATLQLAAGASKVTATLPERNAFRGDNAVTLTRDDAAALRLRRMELRPAR